MTDVDAARQRLIDLENEKLDKAHDLQDMRAHLADYLKEVEEADRQAQLHKLELRRAREDLQRAESLQASQDQAQLVYSQMGTMAEKLAVESERFLWSEGLMEHQKFGIIFGTIAKRWLCGDEPGLGKTREAIGWLDLLGAKKVIIVCEANVCAQFAGEVIDLAPHRTVVSLNGMPPERRHAVLDAMTSRDEGVIVLNFEIWRRDKDVMPQLIAWQADSVIVDEAHNLKNTASANYSYVSELIEAENKCPLCAYTIDGTRLTINGKKRGEKPCPNCGWKLSDSIITNKLGQLLQARSVQNVLLTTGTPILNDPNDIYPLLHLIDPALFRTKHEFQTAYCTMNPYSKKWEFRHGAMERLAPLIAGRYLARSLADAGIHLPEQRIHTIAVDINPIAYPLQYRTIRQITDAAEIVLTDGSTLTIMDIIALITRKRQANVWAAGIEVKHPKTGEVIFSVGAEVRESAKIDALVEKIVELDAEGSRQVVFSQFKTALAEVERRLLELGIRAVRFDGDTPKPLREKIKTNFYRAKNEPATWDVVLANYKTGGTGLNLTAAVKTHELDSEWNPGKQSQGRHRTRRIGQTEPTDVYVYRAPRTIDTWMSNTIQRKQRMVEGFEGKVKEVGITLTPQSLLAAIRSGEVL